MMSSATITVVPDADLLAKVEAPYKNKPCIPCRVDDALIISVAHQEQGTNYLTKPQREAITTELISSDVPGNGGLSTKKIGDIWLCRMLLNTWATLATQTIMGRPFKALPYQLRVKGFVG